MAQQINAKTITLIVQNSKTYQLITDGFTVTALWFTQFLLTLTLSAIASLSLIATAEMKLTLGIAVGTLLLTSKITTSFLNSISLGALVSLTYKISSSLTNNIVTNYVLRVKNYVSTTFDMVNTLVFTLITAVFNSLGDFDTDTLGTMDVQTLGDLDYTAT